MSSSMECDSHSPNCHRGAKYRAFGVLLCEEHVPHCQHSPPPGGVDAPKGSVCEGQMWKGGEVCFMPAKWTVRGHTYCCVHSALCHYKYYGEIPCFKHYDRYLSDGFGYCEGHAVRRETENRCVAITARGMQCTNFTTMVPNVPIQDQPPYDCGVHWLTWLPTLPGERGMTPHD